MMKVKLLIAFCAVFLSVFAQEKREFKFENGIPAYWVKGDDGWGVEDSLGKIIVPKIYGELYCYGNMIYCRKKKNGKKYSCELYNSLGERRIAEVDGYSNLDFVKSKGKWIASSSAPATVFDENGNLIYKYKELVDAEGFKYLINELTDTIVIGPGKYYGLVAFSLRGDVIVTRTGSKEGIVNLDGTMVIPAKIFCKISPNSTFKHEIKGFRVSMSSVNGYEGYYDRQGNCIVPADKYTDIFPLANGLFEVRENGRAIIIDSLCNVKFRTKYNGLELRKDEHGKWFYVTYLGNAKGKINEDGSLIEEAKPTVDRKEQGKEFKYIEIRDLNGMCGATSIDGTPLLPCEYKSLYYSDSEKGFRVYKDGTVGFADNNGKIIIPCGKYNWYSRRIQGEDVYYAVEYMGRWGLCDKNGKELIKPIYDDLRIVNGVIYANVGIMMGVLDMNGNIIVPFEYTDVTLDKKTGNYKVELFEKKGVCDKDGKIIIPARYTEVVISNLRTGPLGNVIYVKDGKTEGLYTVDGRMIFPATLFEHVNISNIKYGLPFDNEWFIRAYNDRPEYCCYYDFNGNLLYDKRQDELFDKYFAQGGDEFDRGNYKNAIDYYNQALGVRQDGTVYYNIGAAYFNLGKYKDAIKYLNSCTRISKSQRITDKASDLIIECRHCLQQKRERRASLWLGILGSALNVATTVVQTNNAIRSYNSNSNSSSSSLDHGVKHDTSLDYLLDPRYAAMQVRQQNWNEYLQTTNGGQTMTYEEWYALKAQALSESQRLGGKSSDTSSLSESSSRRSDPSNATGSSMGSSGKQCRLCLGSGKCKTCNGKGWYYDTAFGLDRDYVCPNCHNHDGKCSSCGGTGRK